MTSPKTFLTCALIALLAHGAFAHTYLSSVYLDDTALLEGDCVRPHPATAFDSPIPLVTQADMTCGWLPYASSPANRKCPIPAGSSIGIQWHHDSAAADDNIIDPTHKGPIMFYLAKSDTGNGNSWFKIYEDGYTESDQMWAVDRLIAADGRVNFTIPSDIAPGNYLLRGEVIALHNGYALNGAQPYVGCVELTISGSGSATPPTVALPGAYSPTDPGMLFNIYTAFTSYPIPGPSVYVSGSSSAPTTAPTSAPTSAPSGPASTSAPENYPTYAPTAAPTSAPVTAAPTSAPATPAPTSAPVTPAPTGTTVRTQMNSGSNAWWFAVAVTGGSSATVKVELMDSGSVPSFTPLVQASYGFYFSQSIQLALPLTLRLTSSSGQQIVLYNAITSWTQTSQVDTREDYGTSTLAPTAPPSTPSAPTSAPTAAPTTAPSAPGTVQLTLHSGTTEWWLAVSVSGVAQSQIASVQLKDSDASLAFTSLTPTNWGYYVFQTSGSPLVAPVVFQVQTLTGEVLSGEFSSLTPGASVYTA